MSGQLHVAEAAAVTPLNIATFVIAVLAWATALVALLWNVLQWLLTPGRARVYVRWGYQKIEEGKVVGSKMFDERVAGDAWYDLEWGEGYIPVIEFDVVNRGRMKLAVREIFMKFAENNYRVSGVLSTGPTLPCSIDSYDFESWTVEIRRLQEVARNNLALSLVPLAVSADSVRPLIRLGNRRTVSARCRIPVGWDASEQNPPSAST